MSKKLILFLMVLLFGSTSFLRAEEVTIGDPTSTTTSSYLPAYSLYNYSLTQQIYTAEEIGMSGTISDVTMWLKNSSSYARNLNIYMKEVSVSAFESNSAWVSMTDADLVATATLPNGISDPVETMFVLDTPFEYSGDGNLLICVQDVTGSWSSGTAGVVMDASSQALYAYRDASLYDPSNPGVTGTIPTNKNVVRLHIESAPVPPTPTGDLVVAPNPFEMGDRPNNGWMAPYTVKITNGGEATTIEGSISNTSGDAPFSLNPEVSATLETGDVFEFVVETNNTISGEYTEEFTLFYTGGEKSIETIAVTANIYQAGECDIVETAIQLPLSYTGGIAGFTYMPTENQFHPNYLLEGMTQMTNDAVFRINIVKDAMVNVNNNVAFYPYVAGFHPTAAIAPSYAAEAGETVTVLAGQYYMIVTDYEEGDIEGTVEQFPAPTALEAVAPEDGATEVESPVTLTWTGGENATQYQVLFGTSPVNMPAVLDWTMVDDNYGSYTVTSLQANTQYFWQIKAKNSNGTVQTVRRGFTTTLTAPNTVTATPEEIFVDESTLIKWKHSSGLMSDLPETQIGSGSGTSNYLPTYNLYNYSLTEQIYTSDELGGTAGYINSISFHPVGDITRNLKVYLANTEKETFTGGSDWVAMTEENLMFEGNVAMVANTWVTINFAEPFAYEGGNLILAVTDHTGTWTSSIYYSTFDATAQALNVYQDSGAYSAITPSGSGTVRNFKNQIIINKDGAKEVAGNRTFQSYNVYYGDNKANTEPITEKQYLLSNLPYNMEGWDINVTAVYDEGESGHSTPIVTVKVSGYATLAGHVSELISGAPVAGATVTFDGKDEFDNDVTFSTTTNNAGNYTVTVKAGTYNRGVATLDGMEPSYMAEAVTVAYNTTEVVDFIIHEEYKPVLSVYAEELEPSTAKVQWSINTMISGGGTGGGGNASTFTEGFEGGMPEGWTVIDGNNDGYTWCLTSAIPSTWTYYASLTLDWYRTGTNAICSGSYINGVGAITPNEYLVMGQQNLVNGSTLSFWAAATDANYAADHFGVAVSDNGTDWTMVQEWTLTGKKGANGGKASRDGNGAKLGTWYNYNVDLSAYAGQKYIAIRHFNCNDQYIMCVDDIELSTGRGRSVQEYALYRKAILKENELVPADSVWFGNITDTIYADFDWNNVEPGLYQYGVSAIYPSPANGKGNRDNELTVNDGGATNSYVPCYGFYADAYLKCEMVYPAEELSEMAGASISSLTFYATSPATDPWTGTWQVFVNEVANATISDFAGPGTVVYEGLLDGTQETMTVNFDTPYTYNGGNLLVGVYLTETGNYKSITWAGEAVTGASVQGYNYSSLAGVTASQRNFLPKTTFSYAGGGGGGNDDPVTPITWSNILPKDMETTVTVNALMAAGTPEGATLTMVNTFDESIRYDAVFDETGTIVLDEDFYKGNYIVTVDLVGYVSSIVGEEISIWEDTEINAVLEEIYKPVDDITVSVTGYALWTEIVPSDRMPEKYFVQLDGVYYGETTENHIIFEGLEENHSYQAGVAVIYSTGMSPYVTTNFTYLGCEGVATQVEDLHVDEDASTGMDVVLVWNGGSPTPPTPPTPPTGGWTEGFESGMPAGWNVIDGNNDGWTWCMTSAIPSTWSYYASLTLDWYRTGTNAICSGSYINGVGALTPDEYLVTPQVTPTAGSTFSFYAAATDASYPADHFGVFVSSNGTSNWTMINEWTLTAKDGAQAGGRESRDGNGAKLGSWHNYSVDLSSYAGQNIYIAIRHFNCNDQYIMCVDDIEFTTSAKLGGTLAAAGKGYGEAANQMTRDWYYYDNGSNEDAIGTGGGNFWWGIMIPAGSYDGNSLTKVAAYDYMAMTGTASIYQGGTTAPAGAALGTVNVTMTGSENFVEYEFATPVELDPAQNVWVIFYNGSGATYPAAVCANTGDANGRWVSLDGSTWEDLAGYGLDYTFMVRAFIEAGGPSPVTPTGALTPNAFNIAVDNLNNIVGATTSSSAVVIAEDFEEHTYYVFYVDNLYGISCPAEITYAVQPSSVDEQEVVNSIYPNPTSGDLHINAEAMTHISIVNAMGQVVYSQDVNADETVIDMAKFESGVYMVSIITENGTSVKRVTVTK